MASDQKKGTRARPLAGLRRNGERQSPSNPYERFMNTEMILRDQLAIDRTTLANERTLLAYIRTVLALVLAGATVMRLFEDPSLNTVGWALIGFGVLVAGVGVWRTGRVARSVKRALNEPPRADGEPHSD